MVQNSSKKTIRVKNVDDSRPLVSICLISFQRPLFLKLCLESMLKNPGITDFEVLIWDNASIPETQEIINQFGPKYPIKAFYNKDNIGQQALYELALLAKGKYYVWVEDDMIWFDDNWLKKLVDTYKQKPWGMLSTNVIQDEVNNGGLWKWMIPKSHKVGNCYFTNQMTPGSRIMDRELALRVEALTPNVRKFAGALSVMQLAFEKSKYPIGMIEDVYVYHATNPFFNQLYPDQWFEKHNGQTISEASKIYDNLEKFDYTNKDYILKAIKEGNFNKYAQEARDKCGNASL